MDHGIHEFLKDLVKRYEQKSLSVRENHLILNLFHDAVIDKDGEHAGGNTDDLFMMSLFLFSLIRRSDPNTENEMTFSESEISDSITDPYFSQTDNDNTDE
jgi:hypothetical protein